MNFDLNKHPPKNDKSLAKTSLQGYEPALKTAVKVSPSNRTVLSTTLLEIALLDT